jgi:hypothetical protein
VIVLRKAKFYFNLMYCFLHGLRKRATELLGQETQAQKVSVTLHFDKA